MRKKKLSLTHWTGHLCCIVLLEPNHLPEQALCKRDEERKAVSEIAFEPRIDTKERVIYVFSRYYSGVSIMHTYTWDLRYSGHLPVPRIDLVSYSGMVYNNDGSFADRNLIGSAVRFKSAKSATKGNGTSKPGILMSTAFEDDDNSA